MFVLTILCVLSLAKVYSHTTEPLLIVVSYDAFRYNYFNKNATPFMSKLKMEGTSADFMKNEFPTKTFPNHFSIATGLHTESHGVVGNSFYDPLLKKVVSYGYDMFHYNKDILPIWTINQMAGPKRHTGVMMWPGSAFEYQNIKPTYAVSYDKNIPWEERVDKVMSWITNKEKPANLIMMYFEEPDSHGHAFGTNSEAFHMILEKVDKITKYIYDQLKVNGLLNKANVIHLSDHGMVNVKPPNFINVTQFLQPDTYFITDTSPCLHLHPTNGKVMDMYATLKKASMLNRNFNVYRKEDLFDRWHIKHNNRTPPIFLLAEEGYAFQDMWEYAEAFAKEYHFVVTPDTEFGCHGYDNELANMHPDFFAYGPLIKSKHKVPPFNSIDLYHLFCAILKVNPLPNNGTYANIKDIIFEKPEIITPLIIAAGGLILSISIIGCILAALLLMKKNRNRSEYTKQLINGQINNEMVVEAQSLLETEEI